MTSIMGTYQNIGRTVTLPIGGMSCAGCANAVERALVNVQGVDKVTVNLALENADVQLSGSQADLFLLVDAVRAAGYSTHLPDQIDAEGSPEHSPSDEKMELTAAILLTVPLVLPMLAMVAGNPWHWPVWVELALATPVQFWIGRRFYAGAWRGLMNRTGNMDQLVVLGTSAAYLFSLGLVLSRGSTAQGQLYFEAAAVIITLVLTGKYLENRAKRSASAALRELMALQPEYARVRRDGQEFDIAVAEIAKDDIVVVRPGERLPVDGRIAEGQSELDESLVTGESMPVMRQTGEPVIAGSMNGNGLLLVQAKGVGRDTTLARIAELVARAQTGKAPIQRLVDRISSIFVPVIIVISLATFIFWLSLGEPFEMALVAAISVMVIACPCALGLATPTALVAGTGAAAKAGILIADIQTLERAHRLDTIIFDKTGTLTEGRPQISDIFATDDNVGRLLQLAASAQQGSEHPLGKAMVSAAKEQGLSLVPPRSFAARTGEGISAEIEGKTIRIGRKQFAIADGPSPLDNQAYGLEAAGKTVAWVGLDGMLGGIIAMADQVRDDAALAVRELQGRGLKVVMASGDNRATAQRIGDDLGIEQVEAELRPEDKVRLLRNLKQQGHHVGMVGDGINDAPSLASADVGFAMGGGSAVAGEAAGITLMRPRPSLILPAMEIAAKTDAKIKQNLFWAFIYNVVGIPIAAFGLLNPAIAGAAMALSSVSVVSNSLLLKRWKVKQP